MRLSLSNRFAGWCFAMHWCMFEWMDRWMDGWSVAILLRTTKADDVVQTEDWMKPPVYQERQNVSYLPSLTLAKTNRSTLDGRRCSMNGNLVIGCNELHFKTVRHAIVRCRWCSQCRWWWENGGEHAHRSKELPQLTQPWTSTPTNSRTTIFN